MEKINSIVKDLMRTIGKKSDGSLNKNQSLKHDLGFDSILIVQLAINVSNTFNVSLDDCEIESWVTLNDIYININKLITNN